MSSQKPSKPEEALASCAQACVCFMLTTRHIARCRASRLPAVRCPQAFTAWRACRRRTGAAARRPASSRCPGPPAAPRRPAPRPPGTPPTRVRSRRAGAPARARARGALSRRDKVGSPESRAGAFRPARSGLRAAPRTLHAALTLGAQSWETAAARSARPHALQQQQPRRVSACMPRRCARMSYTCSHRPASAQRQARLDEHAAGVRVRQRAPHRRLRGRQQLRLWHQLVHEAHLPHAGGLRRCERAGPPAGRGDSRGCARARAHYQAASRGACMHARALWPCTRGRCGAGGARLLGLPRRHERGKLAQPLGAGLPDHARHEPRPVQRHADADRHLV
jgi:hypothetical protein